VSERELAQVLAHAIVQEAAPSQDEEVEPLDLGAAQPWTIERVNGFRGGLGGRTGAVVG